MTKLVSEFDALARWLASGRAAAVGGHEAAALKDLRSVIDRAKGLVKARPDAEVKDAWPVLWDDEVGNLPDLSWLVEGIFTQGGLACLYGEPESGKSFMGIDLALSLATSQPVWGRRAAVGSTFYVYAEGCGGLTARINAWRAEHGVPNERLGVLFLPQPLPMFEAGAGDRLVAQMGHHEIHPILVVIDTTARCSSGAEENSNSDMGKVIAECDVVRHGLGCAVLMIAHPTKGTEILRGASSQMGALDSAVFVKREVGSDEIAVVCKKQKDADHFGTFRLHFAPAHGSRVLRTRAATDLSSTEVECLSILFRLEQIRPVGGTGRTEIQRVSAGDWMEACPVGKSRLAEIRSRLVYLGYATGARGYYTTTESGRSRLPVVRSPSGPNSGKSAGEGGVYIDPPTGRTVEVGDAWEPEEAEA